MKRFIIISLISILLIGASAMLYKALKQKLVYKFITTSLQIYVDRKYGAKLFLGNIRGNLFTNVNLDDLSIRDIKGLPQGMEVKAQKIMFSYSLIDLVKQSPKIKIQGLKLIYGALEIPIVFTQKNRVMTLSVDKKVFNLKRIKKALPNNEDLIMHGMGSLEGEIVLDRFKPKLVNLIFASDNVHLFNRKYDIKILLGNMRSNISDSLRLDNIRIKKTKGFSGGLQLKVKSLNLAYTLAGPIKENPKIELSGLELIYKTLNLPTKFAQQDEIITLTFGKKIFGLNNVQELLPVGEGLILSGLGELEGEVVLERFIPKTFDLKFESENADIYCPSKFTIKADINLNLKGDIHMPRLLGSIAVNEAEYYAQDAKGSQNFPGGMSALNSISLDIAVKGSNIKVKNDSLDIVLKEDLRIKKEPQESILLLGKVELINGAYVAYQNKFKLKKADITFNESALEEAKMDILGETKINRYTIYASVKGTPGKPQVDLNSRPELARDEIVALLLFGKRIDNLNNSEKSELLVKTKDLASSFASRLFLGKVESKIAETIGVDNINIQPDLSGGKGGMKMPSAEAGKYLGNDNFYGTYKIKPGEVSVDQKMKQKPA